MHDTSHPSAKSQQLGKPILLAPSLLATFARRGGSGPQTTNKGRHGLALTAVLLAAGYVGLALAAPSLLLAAIPVVVGAGCTLAANRGVRRPVAVVVTSWLAIGVAGSWWWRTASLAGFGWTLAVLFLLPLPLVPWLYAIWFEEHE